MKRYGSAMAIGLTMQLICLWIAIAPLYLRGASMPNYSGTWVEATPRKEPPLTLILKQAGFRVEMQMSYTGTFGGHVFGVPAIASDGTATLVMSQGCKEQFRHAGYNYDNPGENFFLLSLNQPPDNASGDPILVYTHVTKWNVPCAQHPIGIEHESRLLQRVKDVPANR